MKPKNLTEALTAPMTDEEFQQSAAEESGQYDRDLARSRALAAQVAPKRVEPPVRAVASDEIDEDPEEDEEDEDDEREDSEPPPPPGPVAPRVSYGTSFSALAVDGARMREDKRRKKGGKRGRPAKGQAMGNVQAVVKERVRDEIPRDELLALQTQCPEIRLDICRIGVQGARAGLRGVKLMPVLGVFDMQEAIVQFGGGGTFEFSVIDPTTRATIAPRWKETYEGRPVQPRQGYRLLWDQDRGKLVVGPDPEYLGVLDHQEGASGGVGAFSGAPFQPPPMAGPPNPFAYGNMLQMAHAQASANAPPPSAYDRLGNLQPPPAHLVPAWMAKGYPPSVQWAHVLDQARTGNVEAVQATQAQQASGIALDWVQTNLRDQGHLQADRARLEERTARLIEANRAEMQQMAANFETKLQVERDARIKAERELEVTRTRSEFSALEAKIDALTHAKPAPAPDPLAQIVPLATAFMPLLVESRRSDAVRESAERESQSKIIATVLGKPQPNPIADLMPLVAAFGPLFIEYMKNNSPKMQAEVLNLEHDQRMMMLKMLADMVQANQPEEPPVWAPLIQMGMQWLQGTMAQRQQAVALQQMHAGQQRALPQGQPVQQQQQPYTAPAAALPADAFAPTIESFIQQDQQAGEEVKLIWAQLPPQAGFRSHEWLLIIFNLHVKLDVEQMGEMIASHLYHSQKFNILPPALRNVFEEGQTEPALRTVLQVLPIFARDNEYANAVIARTTDMINSVEEADEEDGDSEDDEDVPEGVIVTPAPGATADA